MKLTRLAVGLEPLNALDAAASFAPIRLPEFWVPRWRAPGAPLSRTKNCRNIPVSHPPGQEISLVMIISLALTPGWALLSCAWMAKAPKTSALIDTRVIYCGDNLEQLRKLSDSLTESIHSRENFAGRTIHLLQA
jgi:hypothetical protein